MPNTYKTVINNAITGFNDIQNLINTNSGQLTQVSNTNAGISSVAEIKAALGPAVFSQQCTLALGTQTTESGDFIDPNDCEIVNSTSASDYYRYIKLDNIDKFTCTTAGLVGTGIKINSSGNSYLKVPDDRVNILRLV